MLSGYIKVCFCKTINIKNHNQTHLKDQACFLYASNIDVKNVKDIITSVKQFFSMNVAKIPQ